MSSISGRRSAASSGGRIAFRTAIAAAAGSAPRKPLTLAPGTIQAATSSDDAATSQATRRRIGLSFGRLGLQLRAFVGLLAASHSRRSRRSFRGTLHRASSEQGDERGRAPVFDPGGRALTGSPGWGTASS